VKQEGISAFKLTTDLATIGVKLLDDLLIPIIRAIICAHEQNLLYHFRSFGKTENSWQAYKLPIDVSLVFTSAARVSIPAASLKRPPFLFV
jgi:hypothetical protein